MEGAPYSTLSFIIGVISAILVFIITLLVSDFFIPPRYNWSKSAYSVLMIKIGMAGGAAFYAFILTVGFFSAILD
jgi:hypothetical protein